MSDPFERFGIYDPVDKLMVTYLVLLLAYAVAASLKARGRRQGATTELPKNRDMVMLDEHNIQHLEHGGTVNVERWHGQPLTLHAISVLEADVEGAPDEPDEPTDPDA